MTQVWTVNGGPMDDRHPGGLPGGDAHLSHKSWSGAGVVTGAQAQARCEGGVGSAGERP